MSVGNCCEKRTFVDGGDAGVSSVVGGGSREDDGGMEVLKVFLIGLFWCFLCVCVIQTLVDVPSSDLATALGFQVEKVRTLQEALQGALDRREEQRQAKELLQLYLKSVEQEGSQAPSQGGTTLLHKEQDGGP